MRWGITSSSRNGNTLQFSGFMRGLKPKNKRKNSPIEMFGEIFLIFWFRTRSRCADRYSNSYGWNNFERGFEGHVILTDDFLLHKTIEIFHSVGLTYKFSYIFRIYQITRWVSIGIPCSLAFLSKNLIPKLKLLIIAWEYTKIAHSRKWGHWKNLS